MKEFWVVGACGSVSFKVVVVRLDSCEGRSRGGNAAEGGSPGWWGLEYREFMGKILKDSGLPAYASHSAERQNLVPTGYTVATLGNSLDMKKGLSALSHCFIW
jgi:hypothetical protein